MRDDSGGLNRLLGKLPIDERIEAWVGAMRKAGGLSFPKADESVRRELFDLEQSTPPAQRESFLAARDTILTANGILHDVFRIYWQRSEALLGHLAAVLSVGLICQTTDTRKLLEEVASGGASVTGKRAAKGAAALSPTALAEGLVQAHGLLCSSDTASLQAYWSEAFGTGGSAEDAGEHLTIEELLGADGDALVRPVAGLVSRLINAAETPLLFRQLLVSFGAILQLDLERYFISPLPEFVHRCQTLKTALSGLPGGATTRRAVGPIEAVAYQGLLSQPRKYEYPLLVILSFEEWLYPKRSAGAWLSAEERLVWRPWEEMPEGFERA